MFILPSLRPKPNKVNFDQISSMLFKFYLGYLLRTEIFVNVFLTLLLP